MTVFAVAVVLWAAEGPVVAQKEWDPEPDMEDVGIVGLSEDGLVRINTEWVLGAEQGEDLDTWTEEGDGGEEGDEVTKTWTCSAGSFKDGVSTGSAVTWHAGATPSSELEDVTITVTATDKREVEPPDTGDRDDEDPDPAVEKVTIWNATITKCDPNWIPEYGDTKEFMCTIYPSDLTRKIRFLLSSSSEDGRCCNFGTESAEAPDLKFPDQTGFTIDGEPEAEQRNFATTTSQVSSAMVTVEAYDYGAYGSISADIILEEEPEEVTEGAYVVGEGTAASATVPLDEDDPFNHIADAWQWNSGAETDDLESNPAGDGTNGDGFERYEEYRGFMVNGTHTRTNPDGEKDVFLCDEDGLGEEDFDATGLTIHNIAADGSEYSGGRVVNFNGDNDQCGIYMYDDGYFGSVVGEVDQIGTPNDCDWVKLYTESIREGGGNNNSRVTWEAIDIEIKERTIGHECGHSINLDHHDGWGTLACVMRDPCPAQAPVPHVYGTANPGCIDLWKLK